MRTAWSAAGRGAHEGADGVERIGGHCYDDEHGEQAVPATPANQDHEREGGRRQQPPEPGRGAGHPDDVALGQGGTLADPQGDLPVGDDDLTVVGVGGDRWGSGPLQWVRWS